MLIRRWHGWLEETCDVPTDHAAAMRHRGRDPDQTSSVGTRCRRGTPRWRNTWPYRQPIRRGRLMPSQAPSPDWTSCEPRWPRRPRMTAHLSRHGSMGTPVGRRSPSRIPSIWRCVILRLPYTCGPRHMLSRPHEPRRAPGFGLCDCSRPAAAAADAAMILDHWADGLQVD